MAMLSMGPYLYRATFPELRDHERDVEQTKDGVIADQQGPRSGMFSIP
jgi:hypothetical protein